MTEHKIVHQAKKVIQHPITGIAIILLLIVGIIPILAHFWINPVEYNQFVIQGLEWKYGVADPETITDSILSAHASGINQLIGNPVRTPPEFEKQEELFTFIFSNIPNYAIVYPTEGFYYYNFIHPSLGKVSGNMRIADLDKGIASIAYFTTTGERKVIIFEMNETKGMKVRKENDYSYFVTYNEKTVHFKLPTTSTIGPTTTRLLPEEEFIGQIHDESDTRLFLVYNHRTHSFYEFLNEEHGLADTLVQLNDHLFIGNRTGFAYYHDSAYNRKMLIGVYFPNVEANNFFDGPGDQVPFRPNIKKKINEAYPNTLLEDGIDDHGVYLNKDQWVRIAISPYDRYTYTDQLFTKIASCQPEEEASLYWTCLTKEWWNNRYWREDMYRQIIEEGKPITIPEWEEFTIDMNTMNIKNLGDWDGNSI